MILMAFTVLTLEDLAEWHVQHIGLEIERVYTTEWRVAQGDEFTTPQPGAASKVGGAFN
jgi:hypothetical protein